VIRLSVQERLLSPVYLFKHWNADLSTLCDKGYDSVQTLSGGGNAKVAVGLYYACHIL
jgi:hypothetical protein